MNLKNYSKITSHPQYPPQNQIITKQYIFTQTWKQTKQKSPLHTAMALVPK
jgi:hypothetical protein